MVPPPLDRISHTWDAQRDTFAAANGQLKSVVAANALPSALRGTSQQACMQLQHASAPDWPSMSTAT
eukprot:349801-Chlamydomonas_euryale.AAC.58